MRYEVWNEKPRIKAGTEEIRSIVPGQSRDLRPETRVGCVGGIGEGGRKSVVMIRVKIIIGNYSSVSLLPVIYVLCLITR